MGRCSSKVAWLGLLLAVGCGGGGATGDGGERADGAPGDGGRDLSAPRVSCDNGVRDGDESGRDCGGSCVPCDDGEGCVLGRDCASGFCQQGWCRPSDACGGSCSRSEQCIGGVCLCGGANGEMCEKGWGCCDDRCIDLASDRFNCGACGQVCDGGHPCSRGDCGYPDPACQTDTDCSPGNTCFMGSCYQDTDLPCMACPADTLCPLFGICGFSLDAGMPHDAAMSTDGGTPPGAANP